MPSATMKIQRTSRVENGVTPCSGPGIHTGFEKLRRAAGPRGPSGVRASEHSPFNPILEVR
jgi:hypothetical protein